MKRLSYSILLFAMGCHHSENNIVSPSTTQPILRLSTIKQTDRKYTDETRITHSFDQHCRLVQRREDVYQDETFLRDYKKTEYSYNSDGLLATMDVYVNYTPLYGTPDRLLDHKTYDYDSKNRIKSIINNGALEWKFEYDDAQTRLEIYSCFQGNCFLSQTLINGKKPGSDAIPRKSSTPDSYYGYWESTFDENGNEVLIEQKRVIETQENKALTRITIDYDTRHTPPVEIYYAAFKGFPAGFFDYNSKRNNRLKETRLTHEGNVLVNHLETVYTYEYNSAGYPTRVVIRRMDKLNNKEVGNPIYRNYEYGCL